MVKLEIEIDPRYLKGWVPVAFRVPKQCEYYVNGNKISQEFNAGTVGRSPQLIVEVTKTKSFLHIGYVGNDNKIEVGLYYLNYAGSMVKAELGEWVAEGTEVYKVAE